MKVEEFEIGKKYTLKDKWQDGEYMYLTKEGYYKDEDEEFFSLCKWVFIEDGFVECE